MLEGLENDWLTFCLRESACGSIGHDILHLKHVYIFEAMMRVTASSLLT
jgi:hypothetical protein